MHKKVLIRKKISLLQSLRTEMNGYPGWLVDGGIGFCIGLLLGFIIRNFGTIVLIVFATLIGGLWLLDSFGLIVVKAQEIKAMLGFAQAHDIRTSFEMVKVWSREHYSAAIGGGVGFIIGWKVGR